MWNRVLCLVVTAAVCGYTHANEIEWGVWTNSAGTVTFEFGKKYEFTYSIAFRDAVPYSVKGAWQTADGICWTGEKKETVGNVILYVESNQCCMNAQILGKRLILGYVWHKGDLYKPGYCFNDVLEPK